MHINAKSLKERWLLFYLSSINSGVWNLKHNTIHIISPQSEMLGHNVTHLMSHITVALLLSSNSMWPTLCDPMDCSTPGFPVLHHLLEFSQTHVHWVSDAIQPSDPLPSPSPPAFNLSQHQGLFQWVSSSHQVAKVLQFHLQHQSFQWTPRTDFH